MSFYSAAQQALADAAKAQPSVYVPPSNAVPKPAPVAAPTYAIPDDFWGLSETSANWENPYYEGPNDQGYHRFDYTDPGSALTHSGNLAASFDQAMLAGLGLVKPIDVSSAGQTGKLLGQEKYGGFAGAAGAAHRSANDVDPDLDRALALNDAYDTSKRVYQDFTTDKYYKDALAEAGIDLSKIKTREDLDKIDPMTKAAVWDIVGRTKQQQNQLPPRGISDSLGGFGGFVIPALAGLVGGPLVAAGANAFTEGISKGNIFDAALGGLKGYGIGKGIQEGFSIPGTNIGTGPIATSGVPAGVNPLDINPIDPSVFTKGTGVGFDSTSGGRLVQTYTPPGGSGGGTFSGGGDVAGGAGGNDRVLPGGNVSSGTIDMPPGPPPPTPPPGVDPFDVANTVAGLADKVYSPGDTKPGSIKTTDIPKTEGSPGAPIEDSITPASPDVKPLATEDSPIVYQKPGGTGPGDNGQGGTGSGGSGTGTGTGSGSGPGPGDQTTGGLPDLPDVPGVYAPPGVVTPPGGDIYTPVPPTGPQTIDPGFLGAPGYLYEAKPGRRHNTRPGDVTNVLRPVQPGQVYGYG